MPPRALKEPKPKTKTFTGCWTCRSRKVKCDGGRPRCLRCAKAGLHCQGFHIRLHWLRHNDPNPPVNLRRQAMSLLSEGSDWVMSAEEIDRCINDLDRLESGLSSETVCAGPFALFLVRNYKPRNCEQVTSPPRSNDKHTYEPDITSRCTDDELHADSPGWSDIASEPASTPPSPVDMSDDNWNELVDVDSSLAIKASRDSLIGTLVHHYVYVVANILQPILHPGNTYTSIYVPSAISTLRKISLNATQGGRRQVPPSAVALFFSVLSSSAFHLRGQHEAFNAGDLARYCRSKALSQLQMALTSLPLLDAPDNTDDEDEAAAKLEAVMSVMLTLVTADVMDGTMSEFWIHLNATRQVKRRLRHRLQPGSNAERLINISSFLTIISETTDLTLDPILLLSDACDEDTIVFGDSHGLEFTYGITATLANFIHRITQLGRCISFYVLAGKRLPADLLLAAEALQNGLSSWSIMQEDLTIFASCDTITVHIAKQHILAFAQAIRIYCGTRILPCSPSELASSVGVVAEILNEIEAVKKKTGYDKVLTASITWPGFIASCEAEPEERGPWYEWWNRMLTYHIGNVSNLWSLVKDAWELRDQGIQETPAWVPALRRRSRQRILAI